MTFNKINQLIKDIFPTILDLKFAIDHELLEGKSNLNDIYVSSLICLLFNILYKN